MRFLIALSYKTGIIITRKVIVKDSMAPVISLNGNNKIILKVGEKYDDLGAVAIDNYDGDITKNVIVEGTVDYNTAGSYEIVYKITDSSGNEAKISEYKLNIDKLNNEINDNNKKLLETISKVEKLNSRKTIILERQKYKLEDTKLHNNLIDLKETNLKLNNDLVNTKNIITIKEEELKGLKSLVFTKI